jgi:hypothetical protein
MRDCKKAIMSPAWLSIQDQVLSAARLIVRSSVSFSNIFGIPFRGLANEQINACPALRRRGKGGRTAQLSCEQGGGSEHPHHNPGASQLINCHDNLVALSITLRTAPNPAVFPRIVNRANRCMSGGVCRRLLMGLGRAPRFRQPAPMLAIPRAISAGPRIAETKKY